MFSHALIPIDLTERCRPALEVARELMAPESRVTVVHVIQRLEDPVDAELEAFYRRLREKAAPIVEARCQSLRADAIDARPAILLGNRTTEIVRHAADVGADLIVMTSHRPDPERPEENWGTISHRVALLSSCPVLLVK